MIVGFVYYSRTGNTRTAAQLLAEKLRNQQATVDLIEIKAVKRPGFFTAGRAAMKEKALPITTTNVDLGKYDRLIVGSPVWAGHSSPFIKTFFSSAKNTKGKTTALFITSGGKPDSQGKPREMMRHTLSNVGAYTSDSFLWLQMRRGTIRDGDQHIDRFIQSILKE